MDCPHQDTKAPRARTDLWYDWLLMRRHGEDDTCKRSLQAGNNRIRDRVLDGAKLKPGDTLVDVGTGEGLIAFGAIERIGPSLAVVLTDISGPLLKHVQTLAIEKQVHTQCRFIQSSAEKLIGLEDASVDAIATRATLAFVADKQAAFAEFFRVLKPGGRMSIAEPICQDEALANFALGRMLESQPMHPQREFLNLLHRYRAAQYPSTEQQIWSNPITNYSDRDLFHLVRDAGFSDIHLELHIDHKPPLDVSWEACLDMSPHPWAPTLREILSQRFTAGERDILESGLRPMIESGKPVTQQSTAYITAGK